MSNILKSFITKKSNNNNTSINDNLSKNVNDKPSKITSDNLINLLSKINLFKLFVDIISLYISYDVMYKIAYNFNYNYYIQALVNANFKNVTIGMLSSAYIYLSIFYIVIFTNYEKGFTISGILISIIFSVLSFIFSDKIIQYNIISYFGLLGLSLLEIIIFIVNLKNIKKINYVIIFIGLLILNISTIRLLVGTTPITKYLFSYFSLK